MEEGTPSPQNMWSESIEPLSALVGKKMFIVLLPGGETTSTSRYYTVDHGQRKGEGESGEGEQQHLLWGLDYGLPEDFWW